MNLPSIERKVLRKEEEAKVKRNIELVKEWLKVSAQELKESGMPIDDSFRILMENFDDIYPSNKIEIDTEKVLKKQKDFQIGSGGALQDGELLEILKTFLFNKYLKDKFIVIRSSLYDDYFNGIDNVIIDKQSGRVVCAIDETSTMSGNIFEEKLERVMECNRRGGAKLEYGLMLKNNKLVKTQLYSVPYLYLPLERKYLLALIKEIDKEKENPIEMKVLMFFLQLMSQQISRLRLENKLTNWLFLEEIESFILQYVQELQKKVRSKK